MATMFENIDSLPSSPPPHTFSVEAFWIVTLCMRNIWRYERSIRMSVHAQTWYRVVMHHREMKCGEEKNTNPICIATVDMMLAINIFYI